MTGGPGHPPAPPPAGRLEDAFDCVVFLTQSDWRTEPRSNRYHYATRFAARLPVYFVQPDADHRSLREEDSGVAGLTLVHCSWHDDAPADDAPRFRRRDGLGAVSTPARSLLAFLEAKGVRRPLLWIYNANYIDVIRAAPQWFKAYHATEDYTLGPEFIDAPYRERTLDVVARCDLLVAVSEPVRQNYLAAARFGGEAITLPNGCDFAFWRSTGAWDYRPTAKGGWLARLAGRTRKAPTSVLYQGGINTRLDFALLEALADRMPDVAFRFCGPVETRASLAEEMAGWARLRERPNVDYLGMLSPEGVAEAARAATVGIAPFRASPLIAVSLPLKSYEYLACGLPVVTAPVPALAHDPANFAFASTVEDYEAAIRRLAPTRADPAAVARRMAAAEAMDYGLRFAQLETALAGAVARPRPPAAPPPAPAGASQAAEVRRAWGPEDLACSELWEAAGARVEHLAQGARLTTPQAAWDYAAGVSLMAPEWDRARERAWLSITVADVAGAPRVGLYDPSTDTLHCEGALDPVAASVEYVTEAPQIADPILLFRNGPREERSQVLFLGARLLVEPKP